MSSAEAKNLAMHIAAIIFGIVSVLHLLRLLTAVPVTIGTWLLPTWINIFGFIVTAFLSYWLWSLARSKSK